MAPATLIDGLDATTNNGHSKLGGIPRLLKSSKSQLPEVKELDSSSATVADAVDALKVTGGVIVRNFLGSAEINRILEDVNPHLEADKPWDGMYTKPAQQVRSYYLTSHL